MDTPTQNTYAQVVKKATHEPVQVELDDDYMRWNDVVPHISELMNMKERRMVKHDQTKMDVILDENGAYLTDIMSGIREAWGMQGFLNKDGIKSFAKIIAKYIDLEDMPVSQDEIDNLGGYSDMDDY